MRTYRAGAVSAIAQFAVVALVAAACGGTATGSTAETDGTGPTTSSSPSGSSPSSLPSGSSSSSSRAIDPRRLLTAADYVKAGIAPALVASRQNHSKSAPADQRAVFGCWAITDVLRRVPGTAVRAKAVRAFTDRSKAHDVAQVVLEFMSAAQAQRFGTQVARRLDACPHPELAVAGVGPEFSNSSAEQLTTACDRSGGFTAIATRHLLHGSNSLVLAMLLVSAGPTLSLSVLLGPPSSNDPMQRSQVADLACARLRG